ncbi:MAG: ATP-binding protein, partial [Pacificimonas sp.]
MGRDKVSIERHFGLTAAPFSAARDQSPLPHVTRATAMIAEAVRSGKLTLLLTGGPGSGKTAALAHLTGLLANPGDAVKRMQADHLPKDEHYRYTHVLLLDEAQAVPQDVLKPLVKARARQGHVTVIAAPERMSLMLRPLVDREVILDGLTTKAAIVYLRDQALAVGGSPDLFSEPAARRLAGSASGSIWALRNLAGKALVSAMLAGRSQVLPEDVDRELFPEVPQEKPEPAATPAPTDKDAKPPATTDTTGTRTASTETIRAAGLIAAAAAATAKPHLASASSVPPAPTLVSADPSAAAPAPEPDMHAAVRRRGTAP